MLRSRAPVILSVFGLVLLLACAGACPSGYYLTGSQGSCAPCAPCPAPFTQISQCGPGVSAGTCGSGIRVSIYINDSFAVNLSLALGNFSGVAVQAGDASGLTVGPQACQPGQFRSHLDSQCHACRLCAVPTPVETSPCSLGADRACAPAIVAQFQALGSSLLVNASAIPALLAALSRPALNASLTQWTYDQVSVVQRSCPAGQYRSGLDSLCHACKTCPPLVDESVPCTSGSDRECGSSIVLGFHIDGVSFPMHFNLSLPVPFEAVFMDDAGLVVAQIPCAPGQFRAPGDQRCHPCSSCGPGETELRACSSEGDAVCSGAIRVSLDVLGSAGVNPASLDLSALKARLGEALGYTPSFALPLPLLQTSMDVLTVVPLPCPPGGYIDTATLLCRPCTACGREQYARTPCAPDADTRCANCTACGPFDTVLNECSQGSNRVCAGTLGLVLSVANASHLDQSWLQHELLGPLLQSLPPGAAVDAGYLHHWTELLSPISGVYVGYDIETRALNCSGNEYLDLAALECKTCSVCDETAYETQACTNQSDTVCTLCNVCGPGQYEACPCGVLPAPGSQCFDANRVCYSYASSNVTIQAQLLSRYDASTLLAEYLPVAVAFIQGQTLAPYVAVHVVDSQVLSGAIVVTGGSGYVSVRDNQTSGHDSLADYVSLFAIPGYPASSGGVMVHTVNFTLGGLFALIPNDALDYSGLLERAMYSADSALVPSAPDSLFLLPDANQSSPARRLRQADPADANQSSPARRLRQADPVQPRGRRLHQATPLFCPIDTYPVNYQGLGWYCISCANDPVLNAQPRTPLSLRAVLAVHPCPPNYARKCYGGSAPPMCIARTPAALILASNSWPAIPLDCPAGQALESDPDTGFLLCVGIPCGPGQYGPGGYCQPCPQGYFKPTNGTDPCTACAAGTYSYLQGQPAAVDCLPCPESAWSQSAAKACACNAGYAGNFPVGLVSPGTTPCAPCGPGTYKLAWGAAPCSQCYPGGASAGQINKQCAVCLPGTYAGAFGQTACTTCEPGRFQNRVGTSACQLCARGFASLPVPPLTFCLGCLSGTYAPDEGLSACLDCPSGGYSFAQSTACRICPNGTQVDQQTCVPCTRGAYGVGGTCADCPQETYAPALGSTACTDCASGTYATGAGSAGCDPCPPGHTGRACQACSQGLYATGYASTTCYQCARGLYTVSPGATAASECRPCQAGTFWSEQGCLACPDNTVAPVSALSVRECLARPGFYGMPGQAAAVCPAGFYCPQASMNPVRCAPGSDSAQGSDICLIPPKISSLRDYDWYILGGWLVAAFLGVTFVVRSRRFWRSGRATRRYR